MAKNIQQAIAASAAAYVLVADGTGNSDNLGYATTTAWVAEHTVQLTDFSATSTAAATVSALTYSSTTGVFTFTPVDQTNKIELTDLSATSAAASTTTSLVYSATAGLFTYTPPDLTLLQETTLQTGTSYTLALGDAGKVVPVSNSGTANVFVPLNASVAFPEGTVVNIYNAGTASVTVAAATTTVTVRGAGTLAQYSEASLRYRGSDEWVASGLS